LKLTKQNARTRPWIFVEKGRLQGGQVSISKKQPVSVRTAGPAGGGTNLRSDKDFAESALSVVELF
jgi:hypothetical protein